MKFNLITLFIILCLGFTSCSENETPEPRTTRTILVYMMANNSLNSFASKNIESMIEGATSKNLNGIIRKTKNQDFKNEKSKKTANDLLIAFIV